MVRNVINLSLLAIFRSGLWGPTGTCPWRSSLIPDLLMSISGSHNTADKAIRGRKQNDSGWGVLGDHMTIISSVVPDRRGSLSARSPTGIFGEKQFERVKQIV